MKILLVEDEIRIAQSVKKGLEEHGYDVETAYDGQYGKKMILERNYDLIVLDIILPEINGIELCKEIRMNSVKTPVLMLTALGTTYDKVVGLDSGADDYLSKPFSFDELLARIRALLRRNDNLNPEPVIKIGDLELDLNSHRVRRGEKEINLTAREYKLLEYFMRNRGKVLDRNSIAENVWDISFDTGTNFVDVYVNYLRNKIDRDFPVKLIRTVVGMGYLMEECK